MKLHKALVVFPFILKARYDRAPKSSADLNNKKCVNDFNELQYWIKFVSSRQNIV